MDFSFNLVIHLNTKSKKLNVIFKSLVAAIHYTVLLSFGELSVPEVSLLHSLVLDHARSLLGFAS